MTEPCRMVTHVNPGADELDSFEFEKPSLQASCLTRKEYPAAAAENTMPGNPLHLRIAKRPGNLPRRPGVPGGTGYVPVGGHFPSGDPTDCFSDIRVISHSHQRI